MLIISQTGLASLLALLRCFLERLVLLLVEVNDLLRAIQRTHQVSEDLIVGAGLDHPRLLLIDLLDLLLQQLILSLELAHLTEALEQLLELLVQQSCILFLQ